MARILAGHAEAEFRAVAVTIRQLQARQQKIEDEGGPPDDGRPEPDEEIRQGVLSSLSRKIAFIEHNGDVSLATAGVYVATGRKKSEVATRNVLDEWKAHALELSEKLADKTAEVARLNDRLEAEARFQDDMHKELYFAIQDLEDLVHEKEEENSEVQTALASVKQKFADKRSQYEAKISDLHDVTTSLAHQQTRINAKVFAERPRLREAGDAYLEIKKDALRDTSKEYSYLRHRLNMFIELVGDYPIDEYTLRHLTAFAAELKYLPANYSVKPKWRKKPIKEIITVNKATQAKQRDPGLTAKTIKVNYIGKIKTIFSYICAEQGIANPFRDSAPIIPNVDQQSIKRKPLAIEKLNMLFEHCAKQTRADEIYLPVLGALTGARLSELVFLQSGDIQKRGIGHYVADLISPVIENGRELRRPTKNDNTSLRFIALHSKLEEIGFVEWALSRKGWLFPELHSPKIIRPGDTASKRFQRIFREIGIHQKRAEVFHSLRHFYKDLVRDAEIAERTIDMQTGHAMLTVGRRYGSDKLRPAEIDKLATFPLPHEIDFSPYLRRISESPQVRPPVKLKRATMQGILAAPSPILIGVRVDQQPTGEVTAANLEERHSSPGLRAQPSDRVQCR